MDLSIMRMLGHLVLKSPIQRTSRRVKWTSKARDMNNSLSLKLCFCMGGDNVKVGCQAKLAKSCQSMQSVQLASFSRITSRHPTPRSLQQPRPYWYQLLGHAANSRFICCSINYAHVTSFAIDLANKNHSGVAKTHVAQTRGMTMKRTCRHILTSWRGRWPFLLMMYGS